MAVGGQAPAPLLLISLDAFRWDYCERFPAATPNLRKLRSTGASLAALVPVYPSCTFPNHYSIVTGLRPSRHGIINNRFFDPVTKQVFQAGSPPANDEHWWGGEPVWITAVRQGRTSACYFWPGSETEHSGRRPTYWKPYDYSVPFPRRLDELFSWLKLPVPPAVITFYFEEANSIGHASGPGSAQLEATLKVLDYRIGQILDRAKAEAVALNVVVVSDHGMTRLDRDHIVSLEDYIDLEKVAVDFDGPVVGLRPKEGDVGGLMTRLARLPEAFHPFRREELPQRLKVGDNPRNPPVWVVVDPGWQLGLRKPGAAGNEYVRKGEHGYDPEVSDMQGILIVNGPAFRSDGYVAEKAENIHIYNLLCVVAGLAPAANDGDDRLVKAFLRP